MPNQNRLHPYLSIGKNLQDALAAGEAVVALESTIISHGMPYPENVETALRVEEEVRNAGAIPATIAILDGQLVAGLDQDQIELLGQLGQQVTKASRRDLPFLLTNGTPGATTVAATMIIAELAGIAVFATGGIGGVHRGAQDTFDISADLQELAQTNVAVVSAGAKAILDLPLTLEYLETYGVPVIGYGTDQFPAFYTRDSGIPVPFRLDAAEEIARVIHAKWSAELQGGLLVANPVPAAYSLDAGEMEALIQQAVSEADQQGVSGKETTPFLLARIKDLSAGRSLVTNIELVLNNARLGAAIAVAYANLVKPA